MYIVHGNSCYRTSVHVHTHTYIRTCTDTHTHTHTHTHIQTRLYFQRSWCSLYKPMNLMASQTREHTSIHSRRGGYVRTCTGGSTSATILWVAMFLSCTHGCGGNGQCPTMLISYRSIKSEQINTQFNQLYCRMAGSPV